LYDAWHSLREKESFAKSELSRASLVKVAAVSLSYWAIISTSSLARRSRALNEAFVSLKAKAIFSAALLEISFRAVKEA
jgi:hypothetical protein